MRRGETRGLTNPGSRLGMIVSPGLTAGGRCSDLRHDFCLGSLDGLDGLGGLLNLYPFLGRGEIISGDLIPLAFCDRVGSVVRGIGVRNDSFRLVRWLMDVSVSQRLVSSGVDFGQASMDNGRVRLDMLSRFWSHSFLLA